LRLMPITGPAILLLKWLYKDGILCLIFQSYDLILIEEAAGTSYNRKRSLFPARTMRGQAFPFYTDCIIIVGHNSSRIRYEQALYLR